MLFDDCAERCTNAASEFDSHQKRSDGTNVAHSLADGLDTLRTALFERAHADVEANFGLDSMLIPVSPVRAELATNLAIETYLVAQSTDEVANRDYVAETAWYTAWLGRMRLGDSFHDAKVQKRLAQYVSLPPDERRLEFSDALVQTLPEASHIPLVLYRLFPIAARIVTAVAFSNLDHARELRAQQCTLLPGIADCRQCRGRVLDNGEQCRTCGNPVWKYKWLTDSDSD